MSRPTRHVHETIEAFICRNCGHTVAPTENGTANRNHCSHCLYSLHLDLRPGDRRSGCRGLMVPIAVWVRPDGEWSILHRCERCGCIRANRIAGDDNEASLLALAAKPLSRLPFPLEGLMKPRPSRARQYEEA
ncbi:MAG: RNHCP domain-containing protein [Spirochaetaceae bacterium]